jgi:hypothetical protein
VINKEGKGCNYLRQNVPSISKAKIQEGIFIGPQVQQLFQEPNFKNKLNATERRAWDTFENVRSNFWGNKNSENYVDHGGATSLIPCLGMQHVIETPFPAIPLRYFSGKYGSCL